MLAVFDLEGTLTQDEFWDLFPQTGGVTADAMEGNLPFRQAMEMRLAAVRPILTAILQRWEPTSCCGKGRKRLCRS